MGLPDRAFASKDFEVRAAALLQVLADVVKSVAAFTMLAVPGGKLGRPRNRVAQALSIGKDTEFTLLVLTLWPLLLSVLSGSCLSTRSSPSLGSIIIINYLGSFGDLAWGHNEIPKTSKLV